MKKCLFGIVAIIALRAQDQNADRMAIQSRAAEIERKREQKAADLQPEKQGRAEHVMQVIEDDRILQRIFGGVNGFRLRMGGLATYSGFGLGPEYDRSFFHNQSRYYASIRMSTHEYWLAETGLRNSFADNHAAFDISAVHFDFPMMQFYGEGPNSQKGARSVYRLEETGFQTKVAITPVDRLRIGGIGRYLMVNVGPGHGLQFAHADQEFTEQNTPGLQFQSNFLQDGAFAQFDWRDVPGNPHSGGNYLAEFSRFNDVLREQYAFDQLHLEAQQYIPFFHKRRVIALRGKVVASDARPGDRVPFYLQPTLGGPDDLRGFRAFRFYDNNVAVLNGEYRWEVFHGLDMALFADAGSVFDRWQQINFRHLETSYGFGFRVNNGDSVVMRLDTGFSREGFAIWFKFGNVF